HWTPPPPTALRLPPLRRMGRPCRRRRRSPRPALPAAPSLPQRRAGAPWPPVPPVRRRRAAPPPPSSSGPHSWPSPSSPWATSSGCAVPPAPSGKGSVDPRSKADRLILRGYGPLAGLIVVLLFLTLLVPSRPPSTVALSGAADARAAVPVPTGDGASGGAGGTPALSGPAATSARPGGRTAGSSRTGAARRGGSPSAATNPSGAA